MTDHKTIRLVIILLGVITALIAGALVVLAYQSKDLPEALTTLVGSGVGGLTAMLVSTRGSYSDDANSGGTVSADLTITAPVDNGEGT